MYVNMNSATATASLRYWGRRSWQWIQICRHTYIHVYVNVNSATATKQPRNRTEEVGSEYTYVCIHTHKQKMHICVRANEQARYRGRRIQQYVSTCYRTYVYTDLNDKIHTCIRADEQARYRGSSILQYVSTCIVHTSKWLNAYVHMTRRDVETEEFSGTSRHVLMRTYIHTSLTKTIHVCFLCFGGAGVDAQARLLQHNSDVEAQEVGSKLKQSATAQRHSKKSATCVCS